MDELLDYMYEQVKLIKKPQYKATITRMIIDDQRNLWVKTNETQKENDKIYTRYDIFNKDGFYILKIWSDINPVHFVSNKMYSKVTDEESGVQTVKRYQVVWKDTQH